jgi:hypothetical protein
MGGELEGEKEGRGVKVAEHREKIRRLGELLEGVRARLERDQGLVKEYERRIREHQAEAELHEEREWSNGRIAELSRKGWRAAAIAAALYEERGYVVSVKAVGERIRNKLSH